MSKIITAPPRIMRAATVNAAGASGYVPTPAVGDQTKLLCGDGTWSDAHLEMLLILGLVDL